MLGASVGFGEARLRVFGRDVRAQSVVMLGVRYHLTMTSSCSLERGRSCGSGWQAEQLGLLGAAPPRIDLG
jgi:hypothetical protein